MYTRTHTQTRVHASVHARTPCMGMGWARPDRAKPSQTEVMKSRILVLFWHPTLPHETTRN